MAANPKDGQGSGGDRRGSYQNDPRYREYYEKLRRENERRKEENLRVYDEEVKPVTLDELSKEGWDGSVRTISQKPTPPTPQPNSDSQYGRVETGSARPAGDRPISGGTIHQTPRPQTGAGSVSVADLESGAILCFDDGSLAIFKDAVSGKDYALFYFLEPNNGLSPRGIFLEQYEYRCIGQVPLDLFEGMKAANRWDRDCIVFHLFAWGFVKLVPQPSAVVSSQVGRPATEPGITRSVHQPVRVPESDALRRVTPERGQVLRINVAGRVWESVYWAKDEMGHVVAHSTNKKWALMHLDLSRFMDSMELGEVKSASEIDEIQRHLMTTGGM